VFWARVTDPADVDELKRTLLELGRLYTDGPDPLMPEIPDVGTPADTEAPWPSA
jgi:hypothetical protein